MLLDRGDYSVDGDGRDDGPDQGQDQEQDHHASVRGRSAPLPRWTVVLPFHNERDYLPITLGCLAVQSVPFRLILVDNGSTDGSAEIAMGLCRTIGLAATLLNERRPGKVSALHAGVGRVATELVATCDADTIYPHDYLARAAALLDGADAVAAVAATAPPESSTFARKVAGLRLALTARLLPQQCLNGGAGQVFRTRALRDAGGFDPRLWNWVLEDHEIMARVEQQGRIAYDRDFLCLPITRPRTVSTVGWKLTEQLRYHASTPASRIAFFREFLAPRLRERALTSACLRREARHRPEPHDPAILYPVRG
ncbi:glycosyltransferase family 2 protein [Sphingobium sufflavum]|uniref:glycosyltransferase n=1 Tax=Sphingobium sufflavum TaxID=1129547 RepID=UPI001F1CE6B1|nr:glycosyltransferase family A protein [Sphingobium sufflavum]MCE7796372.1 glycosyltransferase family 2 protein [Sphingobium sufflavum]